MHINTLSTGTWNTLGLCALAATVLLCSLYYYVYVYMGTTGPLYSIPVGLVALLAARATYRCYRCGHPQHNMDQ